MMVFLAVLCAALAAFLFPKGSSPAMQRLGDQFRRPALRKPPAWPWAHDHADQSADERRGPRGRRATDGHIPWSRAPDRMREDGFRPPMLARARRTGAPAAGIEEQAGRSGHAAQETSKGAGAAQRRDVLLRRIAAGTSGVLCMVTLGGTFGAVIGVLVAVAVWFAFGRLGNAERRRRRARLIADLPVVVDLLAACLRGGAPWHEAVTAVADSVGGPLGDELQAVSVRIRLGADPAEAWLALAEEPMLAPLARTAVRAASTGAALAPTLSRLARDQRRIARSAAAARARAAGIRALAPLGLCFLPAFVLLGVVPAVAGIASTILLPR